MQSQCLAEIFSNPNFTMCSILEPGNQSPPPPIIESGFIFNVFDHFTQILSGISENNNLNISFYPT